MHKRCQIEEIDPELFIYSNYERDWWSWLDLSCSDTFNNSLLAGKVRNACIGYCDSSRVPVRPRKDSYAVMIETSEHEKFWFHMPKKFFEEQVLSKNQVKSKTKGPKK